MIAELTRLAVEEFGEGAEPMDYVRNHVALGGTLLQLADLLTQQTRVKVSRSMVYSYVNASEERKKKMAEAREEGAGAMVDNAIAGLDDDSNEVSREILNANKARADIRLKTAAFWDRKTYGQAQQAVVNINMGDLHLDALRARQAPRTIEAGEEPAQLLPGTDAAVEEAQQDVAEFQRAGE